MHVAHPTLLVSQSTSGSSHRLERSVDGAKGDGLSEVEGGREVGLNRRWMEGDVAAEVMRSVIAHG
jgi:hypothetical protein